MSSTSALCMLAYLRERRSRPSAPTYARRAILRPDSSRPLLTPASGNWQGMIVLIRCFDVCAADRFDGLFHIAAAHSVVPHTAASRVGGFPLAFAHRRRCCCFILTYRGCHKPLHLAKDADWQVWSTCLEHPLFIVAQLAAFWAASLSRKRCIPPSRSAQVAG